MAFLRNLLATLLGLFIFSLLGLFILSGIAAASDTVPEVRDNSVLHLNLSGIVTEKSVEDPFQRLFTDQPSPISLLDLLDAIKAAKQDDRIKGIYLEPKFLSAGSASLKEIRSAILDFRESGKFVYGYGEYISEGEFYLMSACDSVFLHPEGSLEFNGLSAGVTFFKGLFDKLDIEPQIFRVGEYKSFTEPFTRKSMSEENRQQLSALLSSIQSEYLKTLAGTLDKPVDELKSIADQMQVRNPADGERLGLISRVSYEDEIIELIRSELGITGKFNLMGFRKYMKSARSSDYSSNKIAVIVANGDIVMGEMDEAVGGDQFAREIRKARESSSVKAIVLRINSPGGSLTASDMIWREIELTRGVKPVIASMSDVAASGGYYIAAPCDSIVAQPNTITGSIGIFGILFNFGDFLENKLGITNDRVNTGEYSDIWTVTRSLNESERSIIQNQVEGGYQTFLRKVSKGRSMEMDEVKKHAGGRVWSGEQALERGLVDLLGSFDDAIEIAANKAGIADDYRLSFYPRQKPFLEKLVSEFGQVKSLILNTEDQLLGTYLDQLRQLHQMRGLQARLPGDLSIY